MRACGAALVIAGTLLPALLAAQRPSTLYGSVRDAATSKALEDVQILVVGTTHATISDVAGGYTLTDIPAGTIVVRAQRFGYHAVTDTVTLAPDTTVRLEFALPPSALRIDPVVVTAGKRSQLLDQVSTSIAILSDSDIARRAVNTIDEAVDKVPGVQFLDGQVNLRGSSGFVQGLGSRVLLLVDGVPANEGDRGGINWDMLPVDQVERVEIVKGAGSSLYGSAALGGVVNLITREIPTGLHGRLRATGGGYADPPEAVWRFRDQRGGAEGLDLTGSYGGDPLRGAVTAGGRHSDGYREQDRSDEWEALGKGAWVPSPTTRVHVTGSWASHQYQVPLRWCERGTCRDSGQAYQPFKIDTTIAGAFTRSDKGFFAATFEHTATPPRQLSWLARASWLYTSFTDLRRPTGEFGAAHRGGFELRGEAHPTETRVVTVGAEGTASEVSSDAFGHHSQNEFAAYGEGEQRLGSARLTVGARVDYIAVDGGSLSAVVSPRVGVVLPRGQRIWRISAGRGFRAPSLAERFVNTTVSGFTVIPNPSLGPETAWSFELGNAAQLAPTVRTDAAVFWTDALDYIEPSVNTSTGQIQFQNIQRARLGGLDLAVYATPFTPRLTASVAYTFLCTRELSHDTIPARPLAFRPKHVLTLGADYAWGPFAGGADFRYMSRYDRVELYPQTDPQVAPKVLDLRAGYRTGALSLRLLVKNALNYIYNLVPQNLAPVRFASLTVTWTY